MQNLAHRTQSKHNLAISILYQLSIHSIALALRRKFSYINYL